MGEMVQLIKQDTAQSFTHECFSHLLTLTRSGYIHLLNEYHLSGEGLLPSEQLYCGRSCLWPALRLLDSR